MADPILDVAVALKLIALRDALNQLKKLVDERAASDTVGDAIARARRVSEELDLLAPQASVLTRTPLLRHLGFASQYRCEGNDHPDEDASDLVAYDYPEVVNLIGSAVAEPERALRLRAALASLEGPTIEFKEAIPPQNRDLAHEMAALAPAGGSVYLGVDRNGCCVGLGVRSAADVDELERKLHGIAEKSVDPPVRLLTWWYAVGDAIIVEVEVPSSGEPIHYVDGKPYIRDGSASRPARPTEVVHAIREHDSRRPLLRLEPGQTSPIRDQDRHVVGAFAHVQVTNLGHFLPKVRGSVRFLALDGTPVCRDPMPLRWSSAPEPLSMIWTPDGPRPVPDFSKVPQSFSVDFAPGDTDDAAVAIKFADVPGAWGWTGESYLAGWRHKKWQLPEGIYVVEVTVRAEGRAETARFRLDTGAVLEAFAVLAEEGPM